MKYRMIEKITMVIKVMGISTSVNARASMNG